MASQFSITQFKATIDAAGGLSRGVFYECQITLGLVDFGQEQILLCKAANLPTTQLDFTELKYFTRSVKVPAARQFQPVTLTFYNTENYDLRTKLLDWLSRFNQPTTNQRDAVNSLALYGTIELQPKDMAYRDVGEGLYYRFREVFPTSISGLQYSYENDTQVQTYDVEFQYLTATFSR